MILPSFLEDKTCSHLPCLKLRTERLVRFEIHPREPVFVVPAWHVTIGMYLRKVVVKSLAKGLVITKLLCS